MAFGQRKSAERQSAMQELAKELYEEIEVVETHYRAQMEIVGALLQIVKMGKDEGHAITEKEYQNILQNLDDLLAPSDFMLAWDSRKDWEQIINRT